MAWATDEQVQAVKKKLTFDKPGSPGLATMDSMIREALGEKNTTPLNAPVKEINGEPFINLLHALTHGNPISVRMLSFGLDNMFETEKLLQRAEADLNLFFILLSLRMVGEELKDIWKMLAGIHDQAEPLRANAKIVAHRLKEAGLSSRFQGAV